MQDLCHRDSHRTAMFDAADYLNNKHRQRRNTRESKRPIPNVALDALLLEEGAKRFRSVKKPPGEPLAWIEVQKSVRTKQKFYLLTSLTEGKNWLLTNAHVKLLTLV